MKVLARIPALEAIDAAAIPAAAADVIDSREAPAPRTRSGLRRQPARRRRSRFPTASIAALAVLAGIAWSLASWSDARRAERSRLERLARMQPTAAATGTISR